MYFHFTTLLFVTTVGVRFAHGFLKLFTSKRIKVQTSKELEGLVILKASDGISPPASHIDRLFSKYYPIFPTFNRSVIDPNYLIINDPSITMTHSLIGLDIVEIANLILTDDSMSSTRLKDLFAIVTGIGRGKTRLLVEIEIELRKRLNVFPIAITFNHYWIPDSIAFNNSKLNYAAAIVSRMISVYYRISHFESQEQTNAMIRELSLQPMHAHLFIRSCIRHLIEQMRDAGLIVEHFVLLVDESFKIERFLNDYCIHDILRHALLDLPIMSTGKPCIVDLVMSSLNVNSTGVSDSGRTIVPLTTPSSLNAKLVLENWIKPTIGFQKNIFKSPRDEIKLLLLIACLSPIPRAIQFMISVLSECADKPLDPIQVKFIYDRTISKFCGAYAGTLDVDTILNPAHAEALLFGKKILVDDDVMTLIKDSFFTNAINNFSLKTYIVPQTSVVSLGRLESNYEFALELRRTVDLLRDNLLKAGGIETAGRPLEIVVNGLVNARLKVMIDQVNRRTKPEVECSLASLLMFKNLNSIKNLSPSLAEKLKMNCQITKSYVLKSSLPLSYGNARSKLYHISFFLSLFYWLMIDIFLQ